MIADLSADDLRDLAVYRMAQVYMLRSGSVGYDDAMMACGVAVGRYADLTGVDRKRALNEVMAECRVFLRDTQDNADAAVLALLFQPHPKFPTG